MCVGHCPWVVVMVIFIVSGGIFKIVNGNIPDEIASIDGRPCILRSAIVLPQASQCLVPIRSAYNWTRAQSICEMARGSLYQIPSDIQVNRQYLLDCLFSMTNPPLLWINPVIELLPQFRWLNGSAIYPIDFCPFDMPPSNTSGPPGVALSMDSCVNRCQNARAEYAVMSNTKTISSCHCANQLEDRYKVPCDTSTFSLRNTTHHFISYVTNESIMKITQQNTVTSGEILCASLDNHTTTDQHLKSFPCFHRLPFICDLGTGTDCPRRLCGNVNCVFPWQGACLRRMDHPLSWHEAHAYCNTSGGVLWQMDQLPVLTGFSQHISAEVPYWIGASNFVLKNQTNSASIEKFSANFQRVRCGNMFLAEPEERWHWDFSTCDHAKSFLCQYDLDGTDSRRDQDQEIICPWTVSTTSKPITIPDPVPLPLPAVHRADSFPIAALLAGIVAGLVFLVCLTVCCTWCCRSRWKKAKDQKVAFVPYVVDAPPTVLELETDLDKISHGVLIRSFVGSKAGGDSESGFDSRAGSCDRMSKASRDHRHQMGNGKAKSMTGETRSSHQVLTTASLDYMTLEGKMDIQDETVQHDPALPDKPEVTLVTDHVDMNFTVNEATPRDFVHNYSRSQDKAEEEILAPVSEEGFEVSLSDRESDRE